MHHRFQISGAPKVLFERWIHQKLRPQAVIGRVANRLEEAAEDGWRDRRACALAGIHSNRGLGRDRLDD